MRVSLRTTLAALLLIPAGFLVAACGAKDAAGSTGPANVTAAFYPLQFVTERVGGDRVRVTNLVKPGAEPHDLELSPQQVADIGRADLVVYLRGFQPAVDDTVDQSAGKAGKAYDAAAAGPLRDAPPGEEAGPGSNSNQSGKHANEGKDPHVWLDPDRLATIADQVADRLGKRDAAHAADFRSRAGALRTDLTALDKEYAAGLATCQRHEIVTSHAAFGYLAERYHLTQIPITGLTPEEEPTPQHLAEVAALARQHHVTTIFFETLVSPKVAETLAKEVGAKAEVLDPIEGLEPGSKDDYLSVMRANLGTLRTALGCT